MSPRSIRRAIERKAKKLEARQQRFAALERDEPALCQRGEDSNEERKAKKLEAKQTHLQSARALTLARTSHTEQEASAPLTGLDWNSQPFESEPKLGEPRSLTAARLAANRSNAQLSTGPRTCEGKSKVSLNAVKTGLTGRTVLLATDDAAEYERHVQSYRTEYQPVGLRETELVQSLADTSWRLHRIPGLEMAIYAQGRCEFENTVEDQDLSLRKNMIELKTFFKYEKQLRSLQLQESRLARRYEKESAELRNLQKERAQREAREAEAAAKPARKPQTQDTPGIGFEFSTASATVQLANDHLSPVVFSAPEPHVR